MPATSPFPASGGIDYSSGVARYMDGKPVPGLSNTTAGTPGASTSSATKVGAASKIPQPGINNQYPASIERANSDYSSLMDQYSKLLGQVGAPVDNLAAQYQSTLNSPIPAVKANYQNSPNVANSLSNLSDLTANGGYTPQGIADLRERGVSPIRSVYSSAQQGIDRAKRLQGGYSPNYTAATAKLTRGMSDAVSSGVQNVNAGIAQNVASNRLQAAPAYASASATDAGARNQNEQYNSGVENTTNQFNAQNRQNTLSSLQQLYNSGTGNKLEILNMMRQLYGTTPANPALYGQQAATQTGLDLQNKQINNNASSTLINSYRN